MGKYSEYCKRLNDECDWLARNFLNETHTDISIKWIDHDYYFKGDKRQRDVYYIKITRKMTKGNSHIASNLDNLLPIAHRMHIIEKGLKNMTYWPV